MDKSRNNTDPADIAHVYNMLKNKNDSERGKIDEIFTERQVRTVLDTASHPQIKHEESRVGYQGDEEGGFFWFGAGCAQCSLMSDVRVQCPAARHRLERVPMTMAMMTRQTIMMPIITM